MFNAADCAQLAIYQMLSLDGLTVYDEAPENPSLPCVVLNGGTPSLFNVTPETWKVDMDLTILSNAPGWSEASQIYTTICQALGEGIRPSSQHVGGFCSVGDMDQNSDENLRNPTVSVEVYLQCE